MILTFLLPMLFAEAAAQPVRVPDKLGWSEFVVADSYIELREGRTQPANTRTRDDSGLIVFYFEAPVAARNGKFNRLAIYFLSGGEDRKGYLDAANKRVVIFRDMQDFGAIVSMTESDRIMYGTWNGKENGDISGLYLQLDRTNRGQDELVLSPFSEPRPRSDD